MFSKKEYLVQVNHYYATIEYQGHGTPHMHLAVSIICKAFILINIYSSGLRERVPLK